MAALLIATAAPATARAQTGHIAGSPLDVYADGLGALQFRFDGQDDGVFYAPESNVGHAGLELRVGETSYSLYDERTAVSGPDLEGNTLHSVWAAGGLQVDEKVTYENGTKSVQLHYVITNTTDAPLSFAAGELADLYAAGSDFGSGYFKADPPRMVGGVSSNGVVTALVEDTPWAAYQADEYSNVFDSFETGGGLNNTILDAYEDNGTGAEWRFDALAPGQSVPIDVEWRLGYEPPAYVVNTEDDGNDETCDETDCTLREAVATAPAGSVIRVPAGDYTLSDGELVVGNVIIRGDGPGATTIHAGSGARALTISGTASLSGVTVTGGTGTGETNSGEGGGINVDGGASLALDHVTLSGNSATDEGGGIYNAGVLTISHSLIAGNRAGDGGGVGVGRAGSTTITNTTITDNDGRGVYSENGDTLELTNVTVAGNRGGGLHDNPLDTTETVDPAVTMVNTIVADNGGAACSGMTPGDSSHNVVGDTSCALDDGTSREGVDPRLGPLTDGVRPLEAGSPALDSGEADRCPSDDQLGTPRPQGSGCDVGAYEQPVTAVEPPPSDNTPPPPDNLPTPLPAQPTPTPTAPLQLPPPSIGKTVNAETKSGTIRIKLPGSKKFIELGPGQQIPVGTTIDARKGRITLTSAADKNGKTQSADFYQGVFKVLQRRKGKRPVTELKLTETLSCGKPKRAKKAHAARKHKKGKRSRRLWGSGKGRFRTTGKFSSATVRGTTWLTQDRCGSTLTRVTKGVVSVRDRAKRKTVLVKAHHRYVARPRKHR